MFGRILGLSPWIIAVLPGRRPAGRARRPAVRRPVASRRRPPTSTCRRSTTPATRWDAGVRGADARRASRRSAPADRWASKGPSLYVGASIGARTCSGGFPRLFRNADRRVLLVAGAAAGVAAIFKAPATGAVFALEVPYQDDLAREHAAPGAGRRAQRATSSSSASTARRRCSRSQGTRRSRPRATSLGAVAPRRRRRARRARASPGCSAAAKSRMRSHRSCDGAWPAGPRVAVLLRASGAIVTGESLVVGPGYEAIAVGARARADRCWVLVTVLVLRCLATSATVAGGGVGGLFIPLVVAGASGAARRSAARSTAATSSCSSSSASPRSSVPATASRWRP